jgi:hypothetical protein
LNRITLTLCLGLLISSASSAQTQFITATFFPADIAVGQSSDLAISYSATDSALLPGIGLRVHFNSNELRLGEPSQVLSAGMQAHQLKDDLADYDNDLATDKYFLIAWADLSTDGWPLDVVFPAPLAQLPFTALNDFDGASINFSASALAYGYSLDAQIVSLAKSPPVGLIVDTDSDGLPDDYEADNGLDPTNPSDADGDLDGDGVSNLDEFLAGTDPARDELPPQLFIPDDIKVAATGLLTAVDFGPAQAIDDKDGALQPEVSSEGLLESGWHEILWTATDAAGNSAHKTQVVQVLPMASLAPSARVAEGSGHDVVVMLSGVVPKYPVIVPLMIDGTVTSEDFSLSSNQVVIEQGTVGAVALSIALDNEIEPDESLVIKLDQPENAVIGMVDQRTVTIVEDNIAPELELVVTQDGRQGRLVTADGGLITVNARFTDLNPDDSHTVDWAADTLDLVGVTADGPELTIDPSALTLDLIPLAATVSDDGAPILSSSADTLLRRLLSEPDLDSAADTDGDGESDANEGFGDADGDGIPDYLDNIDETYLVPAGPAQGQIMQAAMGNIIRLGDCAFALGAEGVWIDQSQLGEAPCEPDPNNVYPSGLFDFQVSGDQQGEAYNLVLPLSSVIPENASVRTYLGDSIGWQDFTLNAFNAVSSTLAVDGACPAPGSDLYSDSLAVGANCLQLSIEDGGPNDIDAAVDGTVTHFSGIAIENIEDSVAPEPVPIPTQVQSSSGGGCTVAASGAPADGSLLLLLLLGLLRMVRGKIKLGELKAVA